VADKPSEQGDKQRHHRTCKLPPPCGARRGRAGTCQSRHKEEQRQRLGRLVRARRPIGRDRARRTPPPPARSGPANLPAVPFLMTCSRAAEAVSAGAGTGGGRIRRECSLRVRGRNSLVFLSRRKIPVPYVLLLFNPLAPKVCC
jgi:hypothetical protein